jgi:hypothetical protein
LNSDSRAVVVAAGFGGLPLSIPGLVVVDHTESLDPHRFGADPA